MEFEENKFPYFDKFSCHFANRDFLMSWELEDNKNSEEFEPINLTKTEC